jgi:hypothetical protein
MNILHKKLDTTENYAVNKFRWLLLSSMLFL